jgi:predicted membrane-bound spermidine synthase
MKKYSLESAVIVCGFVVMVFEIIGSRIFAPYLGTSLYVWTSSIGVILASLSLGYWWGGRLADKRASAKGLASIIVLAALSMLLVAWFKFPFLILLSSLHFDLRISALVGAVGIFGPVSTLLGMVSPYAVRLKIQSLDASGRLVGNLYAISTLGSILGTFLAGYVLVAYLGTTKILLLLAIFLIVASFTVYVGSWRAFRGSALVVALIFLANLVAKDRLHHFEQNHY